MAGLYQHRYYPLIEEALRPIQSMKIEGKLDSTNLLDLLGIHPETFLPPASSISQRENEINTLKALVLAQFILTYMISPENEVQPIANVDELRAIFLDHVTMTSLLDQNAVKVEENPFQKFKKASPLASDNEAEWQGLLIFANYLKYAIKLLREPPNKVVSMRAAAILSGFEKCLEGGWSGLGPEAKRRHLIYHFLTGINRAPRSSKKREKHSELPPSLPTPSTPPVLPDPTVSRSSSPTLEASAFSIEQSMAMSTDSVENANQLLPIPPPLVTANIASHSSSHSIMPADVGRFFALNIKVDPGASSDDTNMTDFEMEIPRFLSIHSIGSFSRSSSVCLADIDNLIADLEGGLDFFQQEEVVEEHPPMQRQTTDEYVYEILEDWREHGVA
eukprot:scaffold3341_cov165-Ochromonas_danica.AAC.19